MDDERVIGLEPTVADSDSDLGNAATAASGEPVSSRLTAGVHLGRYQIVSFLGAGAMGAVYRARDPELARDVAVKQISRTSGSIDDTRTRLRREAQAMARVDHPAVVKIYDVGVDDNQLFVAMELVEGGTLLDWLHARPRTWREVVEMFVGVGRGLAAAHDVGLVHRDVKPGNILVDVVGRARISDFGLARAVAGDLHEDERSITDVLDVDLTATGGLVGTPAYMAPEQLESSAITAAADQFSFAVSLWEALFGARPFRCTTAGVAALAALRETIAEGRIEVLAKTSSPRPLELILRRALANEPAKRWPSVTALTDALEAIVRPRRSRWIIGAGLVLACGAATLLVWRPWAAPSTARTPSLQLGVKRTLERHDNYDGARILLRGNRIARLSGSNLTITSLTGVVRETFPLTGRAASETPWIYASSVDETVNLLTMDPTQTHCTVSLVSTVRGVPPRLYWNGACTPTVDMAPDRATFAVASSDRIAVRDLATGIDRWSVAKAGFDHDMAWSPDGSKIAVTDGKQRTIVLDAATGGELAQALGGLAVAWLDDLRLVHTSVRANGSSDIRVLAFLPTLHDDLVQAIDGTPIVLGATSTGLMVSTTSASTQVYVTPSNPAVPVDLDAVAPLDTGAERDQSVVGWTSGGEVLTWSKRGDETELRRTPPDGHGGVLVRAGAGNIWMRPALPRIVWGQTLASASTPKRCLETVIDLATGNEHVIDDPTLCDVAQFTCEAATSRCLVTGPDGAPYWLDLDTGAKTRGPEALGTILARGAALSPDGRKVVEVRPDHQLVVHGVSDGSEVVIALDPPLDKDQHLLAAFWGQDALFVTTLGTPTPTIGLLSVRRDGHWNEVVRPKARQLYQIWLSPDGRSLALTANSAYWTYDYYAILPPL